MRAIKDFEADNDLEIIDWVNTQFCKTKKRPLYVTVMIDSEDNGDTKIELLKKVAEVKI